MPKSLQVSPALYDFLSQESRRLARESLSLIEWLALPAARPPIKDFSFAVFPIAKAYEGFLRDYFYQVGLLTEKEYQDKHFRIGRSFNPDLPNKLRNEDWIYDDVAGACSEKVARDLWDAWVQSRNHLFHYYAHGKYQVTYEGAISRISQLIQAMEAALECKIEYVKRKKHVSDNRHEVLPNMLHSRVQTAHNT